MAKWIAGAIKRPGALSRTLGVPIKENIPEGTLREAAAKKGRVGRQARVAITLNGFKKKRKKR